MKWHRSSREKDLSRFTIATLPIQRKRPRIPGIGIQSHAGKSPANCILLHKFHESSSNPLTLHFWIDAEPMDNQGRLRGCPPDGVVFVLMLSIDRHDGPHLTKRGQDIEPTYVDVLGYHLTSWIHHVPLKNATLSK
jgi:hypothetical protein